MKLATILSVLPLAFALPHRDNAKRSPGAFTVISARSASPVHLLSMTAAGSYFYLGGEATTYCPAAVARVVPCPKHGATVFDGNGAALVCVPFTTTLFRNKKMLIKAGCRGSRRPGRLCRLQRCPPLHRAALPLHG